MPCVGSGSLGGESPGRRACGHGGGAILGLYVLDGELLGVGGFAFHGEPRRADKTTPVVFFTGKAYEERREAGMLAGAEADVVKPCAGELIPTVRRLLEESRCAER